MNIARTQRPDGRKRAPRRESGFSLIELMVALTLGLLIVAAMLANLNASATSNRTNARVAEYQTNGRFAADFLRREIQHAGFAGVSWTNLTEVGAAATTNDGCGIGFAANIAQPIWGANDSNPFSGTCIPAANYARGDVLVLRRAGLDAIPTATALSATRLYFRAEYLQGSVYLGPTRPTNLQTPVADYPLQADIYYISPWTTSSTENPKIPALYRVTLGDGPAMTAQLVASGIENMQVQYGVSTAAGMQFYDASAVPAAQWTSVVAVRLWLLARSSTREPGYTNNFTTDPDPDLGQPQGWRMGDLIDGNAYAVTDGYQRQVFPLVVQIRK